MSIKALPARGIYGWDSTNETWVKILVDSTGKVQIVSTTLTTILEEIQNATYGLEALKALIDAIDVSGVADAVWDEAKSGHTTAGTFGKEVQDILTALQHGTYGLSAIETLVDGVETDLTAMKQKVTSPAYSADTDSLEAISEALATHVTALGTHDTAIKADIGDFSSQTYLQTLLAALGIPDVSGKSLYTCLITDRLDNATYGLNALKLLIDAIETALPADPADASDIAADFDRHLTKWDIWAESALVQIPTTADQDVNLPSVVVPALPTGATIFKVYLLFKCSIIRDTSGADNAIDESGTIEIKLSTDDWDAEPTEQLTAYTIDDNMWAVDVTNVGRDRGGDAFVGSVDLSSIVDAAGTYNLRLESVSADGTNLELHECAVGLRILFY